MKPTIHTVGSTTSQLYLAINRKNRPNVICARLKVNYYEAYYAGLDARPSRTLTGDKIMHKIILHCLSHGGIIAVVEVRNA